MQPPEHNVELYPYPPLAPVPVVSGTMRERERLLSDCFAEAFRQGDLQEAWATAFDMLRLQTLGLGTLIIDCYDWQSDSRHGAEPSSPGTLTVLPLENWGLMLDATEQAGGQYLNPVQMWQQERAAGHSTSPRSIEAMQQVLRRGLGVFRWVSDGSGSRVMGGPMIVGRDGRGRVLTMPESNQTELTRPVVSAWLNDWGYAENDERLMRWADENLGNGGEVVHWLLGADPEEVSGYIAKEPMSTEVITPTGITGQIPADLSDQGLDDDWDQEWLTD